MLLCISRSFWNKAVVLTPRYDRLTDVYVYAYAKQPLKAGEHIAHCIGNDQMYGLIRIEEETDNENLLPIELLDTEKGVPKTRIKHKLSQNKVIRWSDVELPDSEVLTLY
ncbi:hypothetical protein [Candidatus Coxiella mudrowiae]|uniref:hypothetical protein n=1 Tax=Candidatus Coxiella mudrowiae TaxID=2054173 RepID=UPI001FD0E2C3|nr:hypothetical protein [Candidatus Coxiella mudrowiae]